MLALSPATLRLHAELAETLPGITGIDHGYQPDPYLRCTVTEGGIAELRAFQSQRASEGVHMEWLSGEEARAMSPWITANIIGALRSDNEPTVDSYRLTMSALQAAEKGGARMMSGRVVGLLTSSAGVRLEDGTEVHGGAVVLAMGPWSGAAAEWLGHPVPVKPQRGELVYLSPPEDGDGPELEIGMDIVEDGGSLIPKRLSDTIVAASKEYVGFDRSITTSARDELLLRAARLSSRVQTARISGQTACLRPVSADGRAYVGLVPGWDAVYLATGHNMLGLSLAPATGRLIAEMVQGRSTHIDASAFRPERFG